MKVVLFCGGLGMRLRDYSETVPKPMVTIGYRPVLWHVMKYYAHFGHNDFILCLGHRGDVIKQYFLNYNECISNDFVLENGGKTLKLLSSDIDSWRIAFVETGLTANVGERLAAVRKYVQDEPYFLANFSDGLTNMDLNTMIEYCRKRGRTASLMSVRPSQTFHAIQTDEQDLVTVVEGMSQCGLRINGGYFLFNRSIFDFMRHGEDLVDGVFGRLAEERELLAYPYDGFWTAMDTFKDKQRLDELYAAGQAPWELWRNPLPARKEERQKEERWRDPIVAASSV